MKHTKTILVVISPILISLFLFWVGVHIVLKLARIEYNTDSSCSQYYNPNRISIRDFDANISLVQGKDLVFDTFTDRAAWKKCEDDWFERSDWLGKSGIKHWLGKSRIVHKASISWGYQSCDLEGGHALAVIDEAIFVLKSCVAADQLKEELEKELKAVGTYDNPDEYSSLHRRSNTIHNLWFLVSTDKPFKYDFMLVRIEETVVVVRYAYIGDRSKHDDLDTLLNLKNNIFDAFFEPLDQ